MEPAFKPKITPIDRIQENLVARVERRALNWLCARMPRRVSPDMLTAFGMFGALLVFTGYLGSNLDPNWLWLSIGGYVVHWLGDSLDGSLARFRKIERPRYGYFLDHSCDGFATTLLVVGIGLSPFVLLEVSLVALAGYLLMSIHAFLSVRVLGELRLSYLNAGAYGDAADPGCPDPGNVHRRARSSRSLATQSVRYFCGRGRHTAGDAVRNADNSGRAAAGR